MNFSFSGAREENRVPTVARPSVPKTEENSDTIREPKEKRGGVVVAVAVVGCTRIQNFVKCFTAVS